MAKRKEEENTETKSENLKYDLSKIDSAILSIKKELSEDTVITQNSAIGSGAAGGGIYAINSAEVYTLPEFPDQPVRLTSGSAVTGWAAGIKENIADVDANVHFQQ